MGGDPVDVFILYRGTFPNETEPLVTELKLWGDTSFVLRQSTSAYREAIMGEYRIAQDTLFLHHDTGYTNYYLIRGDTLCRLNSQKVEDDLEYLLYLVDF